jgi:hypothetical protein
MRVKNPCINAFFEGFIEGEGAGNSKFQQNKFSTFLHGCIEHIE